MDGRILYMDTSALAKLIRFEVGTEQLHHLIGRWPSRTTSELGAMELVRVARRLSDDPSVHAKATDLLGRIHLSELRYDVLQAASLIEPATLGSLDAIHLATALALGDDLGAFVTYDRALGRAALDRGLDVIAPGVA